MIRISSGTVLPAQRHRVVLRTADGLDLVGELARPHDRKPVATVVGLHPLPTAGGSMDSHVLRKLALRLPALTGVAVLRFNTRGTASVSGRSSGSFDSGVAERWDLAAALDLVEHEDLPAPWLVGWSFGSDLAIRYGCDPTIAGAILLSPPLRFSTRPDLAAWAEYGKPLVALVPEHDEFLRPVEACARFAVVPQAQVVCVAGARHLWVGERHVRRVLDEIVRCVAPAAHPLPVAYAGGGAA